MKEVHDDHFDENYGDIPPFVLVFVNVHGARRSSAAPRTNWVDPTHIVNNYLSLVNLYNLTYSTPNLDYEGKSYWNAKDQI